MGAVGERGFKQAGPDEAARSHDQLRTALMVEVEVRIDQALHHAALAVADDRHVHGKSPGGDAKILAIADVVGHLRTVDDVLAGKARNVGTGAADVLTLDGRNALPARGEGPGKQLGAGTAAKNDEIVVFRLRLCCHASVSLIHFRSSVMSRRHAWSLGADDSLRLIAPVTIL